MFYLLSEIKAVVKHRELLWQMTSREIKARYKQSILGYFWVVLNPLAQMLVMSFAFSLILRIPTNAASHIPYSIFLFIGLLPWNLFSTTLNAASISLVDSSSLITKIYFPRSILVLAALFSKLIDFVFSLSILIIYLVIYQIPINLNVLWVVPIFLIQMIFTLGLSLFFAASNLIYRDIKHLLSLILTLWMYATPIIYPADIVPDKYKIIFQINPMAVIINAYRQTVLGGGAPNFPGLLIALLLSLSTLILCLTYFKKRERTFADII